MLISCGEDKKPRSSYSFDTLDTNDGQFQTGACGGDIISDYNSVVSACRRVTLWNFSTPAEREEIKRECNSKIDFFLKKYPGINCQAQEGYGLDKKDVTVTEARVKAMFIIEEMQSNPSSTNENKNNEKKQFKPVEKDVKPTPEENEKLLEKFFSINGQYGIEYDNKLAEVKTEILGFSLGREDMVKMEEEEKKQKRHFTNIFSAFESIILICNGKEKKIKIILKDSSEFFIFEFVEFKNKKAIFESQEVNAYAEESIPKEQLQPSNIFEQTTQLVLNMDELLINYTIEMHISDRINPLKVDQYFSMPLRLKKIEAEK